MISKFCWSRNAFVALHGTGRHPEESVCIHSGPSSPADGPSEPPDNGLDSLSGSWGERRFFHVRHCQQNIPKPLRFLDV
jgi:hypothetical protein